MGLAACIGRLTCGVCCCARRQHGMDLVLNGVQSAAGAPVRGGSMAALSADWYRQRSLRVVVLGGTCCVHPLTRCSCGGGGGGVNDYFWGFGELRQWFYL